MDVSDQRQLHYRTETTGSDPSHVSPSSLSKLNFDLCRTVHSDRHIIILLRAWVTSFPLIPHPHLSLSLSHSLTLHISLSLSLSPTHSLSLSLSLSRSLISRSLSFPFSSLLSRFPTSHSSLKQCHAFKNSECVEKRSCWWLINCSNNQTPCMQAFGKSLSLLSLSSSVPRTIQLSYSGMVLSTLPEDTSVMINTGWQTYPY